MADTRCPMCGKPNPEGAEACAFCGARLKPLDLSGNKAETPSGDGLDWLSGLRGDSGAETPSDSSASESDAAPGEVPDWLSRIRGKQDEEPSASSDDDWLRSLAPSGSDSAEEETPDWLKPESSSPEPAAGEGGDWLKNLQSGSAPQPPEKPEDWLSEFNHEPSPSQPEPQAGESGNWLDSLRAPVDEQPSEAAPAESEPPAQEPAAGSGSGENWMSGLADWSIPSQESEAAAEPSAAQPPAADLSDWLKSLDSEEPAEQKPQPEQGPNLDWMNDTPVVPPQRVQADGLPDWTPPKPGDVPPDHIPDEKTGLTDWLSSLPSEDAQEPAASEPASPAPAPTEHSGLTDWLSMLPQDEQSGAPAPSSPVMPWDMPASSSSPFTVPSEQAGSSEEPPAAPAETPDWLKAFAAELPSSDQPQPEVPQELPGASQDLPLTPGDLPDWLSEADDGLASAEIPSEETPREAAPASDDSLEKANLPNWLMGMRPVEAVVPQGTPPQEGETTIEKSGPLAGMVNALPGQELVTRTRKPPAYSARLQASEKQRQYADMIDSMLSEESRPQGARPERSHMPERVVRLIIALALIVLLAFPIITGTRIMPLPTLGLQPTINFGTILSQLPEGAPVLLAVDYEPGLSGELTLAGSPVIDHLAARKAKLVVMSTVPTGPVLAENLLKTARESGLQAENLGFLPGGTAGLQEFASLPRMTMPVTLSGESAWNDPALPGDSLNKFAAVVVMTDNAETARSWIEQVQPSLGQSPLLFVVSAQAAPMLQPYIDSKQVQGMVSGLAGGSTYEQITGKPGAAQGYWDAYQFGMFAAMLLVLVGALAALFGNIFRRPASKKRRA